MAKSLALCFSCFTLLLSFNCYFEGFLSPILIRCVPLLSSNSQALTNAVLELFSVVTRKLAVYIDEKEDTILLYQVTLFTSILKGI